MAFVRFVSVDGVEKASKWAVIREAIGALARGQARSLSMGLDETGDTFLIVSRCEPSGLSLSSRADGELDEYDLIDVSRPSELVECVVGVGRQTLSLDAIVGPAEVESAAEHFFRTGKRLAQLDWRKSEDRHQRMAAGEAVRRM